MGRYPILLVFSWTLMALGVLTWVLAGVGVVILLTIEPSMFRYQPGNIVSELIQLVIGLAIWRLVVGGFVAGISLLGMGQFFILMMDMADDTRIMRLYRDGELVEKHRPDYRR